jgi:caffeoyl-CoA O-methyltransferase
MNNKTIRFTDDLYDYLLAHNLNETDAQRELRERTAQLPESGLQIAPEQTAFLQLLARLTGSKRALEIGVFTGYSALAVALTLPSDGKLIACDVSAEWVEIGRPYWRKANVEDIIETRIGPAMDTLDQLIASGRRGGFDFAFIDADKPNYPDYYERCMILVRSGGLIAFDNTLWQGKIAGEAADEHTRALKTINDRVHADDRVHSALVNVGDGMTLALKK